MASPAWRLRAIVLLAGVGEPQEYEVTLTAQGEDEQRRTIRVDPGTRNIVWFNVAERQGVQSLTLVVRGISQEQECHRHHIEVTNSGDAVERDSDVC